MDDQVSDYPALLALWDTERNELVASAVKARSFRSAYWKCPEGHSFQRKPRMMLRDEACPLCRKGTVTLADAHPGLAKIWHPKKNGTLTPGAIDAHHTDKVWWRCKAKKHSFDKSPLEMGHDASCPHCSLEDGSLAAQHPTIAAEWNTGRNELNPEQVKPDHMMTVWWTCSKGHEFQQSVRKRTKGHGRCPICFGAWSVDNIRSFVKSLLGHITHLNPSETFALAMQAGVLKNKDSRAFVMALSTGRFPMDELEKFTEGKPSLVDEFAERKKLTLEIQEAERELAKAAVAADQFALPDAPTAEHDPADAEIDLSVQIELTGEVEEEDAELPIVQTKDALAALDNVLIANADAETVKFLIDSAMAKLWRHAYLPDSDAKEQAEAFEGDTYSNHVRDLFLTELREAEQLVMPDGYAFRPTPSHPICQPHLMQRHVAVAVQQKRRYGNWSGMGAGKTLSAIIATRLVDARLTVICCPNAVVKNWAKEIENAFPGCDIQTKTWTPEWADPMAGKPRYLIMNFEQFQLAASEEKLVAFMGIYVVDFVVIDEIHYAKQRSAEKMSRRKHLVQGLVLESAKKTTDLCVLGMSGTPVINNIQEGRSLIELITGHKHDDLETKATVQNCMRLYQKLVTLGTRWQPNYKAQLDESNRPEIDCSPYLEEIREVGHGTVLELEQVLTRIRIPTIIGNIKAGEKVLIYSYYVDGIVEQLRDAVRDAGFRAGLFTGGQDDTDLDEFRDPNGNVDVLIASSRVSTGVDGIQHVCSKVIVNCLPWTNAEYEQLRGRVWRQGQDEHKTVEIIVPVTFAIINGERWSYCESKLNRLHYKKSIADAAVDGVVPEGNLRTSSQAQQDIMSWLTRLDDGNLEQIVRAQIEIPLSGEPSDLARRVAAYGDFSKMNNRWYASSSNKTHSRLSANPEEWGHYHTMYSKLRESWQVVPYKEEVRWLSKRGGMVVGDFGCGEALIQAEVGGKHLVHSFDHVAINASVDACDIANVPLDDNSLELAIFCLALMGSNFTDYIREAHRCLQLDGRLHIWESASYFDNVEEFCAQLAKLGFEVMHPKTHGRFLVIRAVKNADVPHPDLKLSFRGH